VVLRRDPLSSEVFQTSKDGASLSSNYARIRIQDGGNETLNGRSGAGKLLQRSATLQGQERSVALSFALASPISLIQKRPVVWVVN